MMTLLERVNGLEKGDRVMILATRFEHAITGTQKVGIMPDRTIRVVYEDGVEEKRVATESLLAGMEADNPSLFGLVGYVQEGRT